MADDERRDEEQSEGGEDQAPEAEGSEEQGPEEQAADEQAAAEEPGHRRQSGRPEERRPLRSREERRPRRPKRRRRPKRSPPRSPRRPSQRNGRRRRPRTPRTKKPPGAELEPIAIEPQRELGAEERARLEAEAEERARLEAEATAEGGEELAPAREPAVEVPSDARIQATGKRKTSIARVVLRGGDRQLRDQQAQPRGVLPSPPAPDARTPASFDLWLRGQGGCPGAGAWRRYLGTGGRHPSRHCSSAD